MMGFTSFNPSCGLEASQDNWRSKDATHGRKRTMDGSRDIFLSHATADKPLVRTLANRINERQINGQSISYWLDEAEITGSVPGAINGGLEKSAFFAAIMTPSYFNSASGWTDAEWHAALASDPDNRSKRFLPILVLSCPHIPALIRHFRWFDLREDRDGREFDRLIALLQGRDSIRIQRGREIDSTGAMSNASAIAERAPVLPKADALTERLTSNLLPVLKLPDWIYRAPLNLETRKRFRSKIDKKTLCDLIEAKARENEMPAKRIPPFRLAGDVIYSFFPL